MIAINTVEGIFIVLIGLALVFSVSVNLYTQKLLNRCLDVLLAAHAWLEEAKYKYDSVQREHDGGE